MPSRSVARLMRCRLSHGLSALLLLHAVSVVRRAAAQVPALLRHPAGFALSLPAGWRFTPLDSVRYQLVPPDASSDEVLVIVGVPADGVTSVTDPAFIAKAESDARQMYPQLRRIGPAKTIRTTVGAGARLDWEGSANGTMAKLSIYMAVKNGLEISLITAGPRAQVERRAGALDRLFAGVRLDARAAVGDQRSNAANAAGLDDGSVLAREWRDRLRGRKLTVLSGYSSGGSSGGMTSRSDLVLQQSGQFTYNSSSSVSISVDGMGGNSSGRRSSAGRWRIVSRGGVAVLLLTATDGGRDELSLSRRGSQTFLNRTRAFVTVP